MLLMIDNYDSFTYNLVQYLGELGEAPEVVRNDAVTVDEVAAKSPRGIVISPGPCTPNEAGISLDLIMRLGPRIPILGICLGHEAIAQVFGGRVVRARKVMHGKLSTAQNDGRGVFAGLPSRFEVVRYHSLVAEKESLPECLEVSAWTGDATGGVDEIMGLRHREHPIEGLQFHPESIASSHGREMLANFLKSLPQPLLKT